VYDKTHTKERRYLSSKPPPTVKIGRNQVNPTIVGYCIIYQCIVVLLIVALAAAGVIRRE